MSACQKLHAAYIHGGLIVAALVGALARSWVVFAIAAAVLIGLSLLDGEIRPRRRRGSPSATSHGGGAIDLPLDRPARPARRFAVLTCPEASTVTMPYVAPIDRSCIPTSSRPSSRSRSRPVGDPDPPGRAVAPRLSPSSEPTS